MVTFSINAPIVGMSDISYIVFRELYLKHLLFMSFCICKFLNFPTCHHTEWTNEWTQFRMSIYDSHMYHCQNWFGFVVVVLIFLVLLHFCFTKREGFRISCYHVEIPRKVNHPHWHDVVLKPLEEPHYSDVVINAITSQITGVSIVFSTVFFSGEDQRKHQSFALWWESTSEWWITLTKDW